MEHFPAYHERRLTDGTHVFVATTGGAKRDGLALDMGKGQFANYLRNPVFLWAHDYQGRTLPIGKTVKLVASKTKVRAHVLFDQGDEFARAIERKYDEGYLSAVSVGWMDMEDGGWDLLDISAVPVPGDPDALIEREVALMRAFLGEHDDHQIEDVEPKATLEVEPDGVAAAEASLPVPRSRTELGELIGEKLSALKEAIAEYEKAEQPAEEPDGTAAALGLLAETLKEMQ